MRAIKLLTTVLLLCGWAALSHQPGLAQSPSNSIAVALFSQYEPEQVTVEGIGAPLNIYAGDVDEPLKRIPAGTPVSITLQREQLYLALDDGGIYALTLRLAPEDKNNTLRVTLPGPDPRAYFGALMLEPDGASIQVINTVEMETYIACVLGAEYGLDDLEGTKAMAVAVRTYALHPRDAAGRDGVLSDTRMSQVYRGAEYANERNFRAASATRGQVLTYNGSMIDATYYSSSGGYTADNSDVWSSPQKPYLRAQPDPYDAVSPYQHWREEIDRRAVLDILSDAAPGEATGFVIEDRNAGGRVTAISVLREGRAPRVISGANFRARINRRLGPLKLKSTFFDATRRGGVYVFEGRGFGHAAGMSQWGAHGMAQQGHSYREILAFYYPGTEITQIEGGAPEPLVAESRPPQAPPPKDNVVDDNPALPENPEGVAISTPGDSQSPTTSEQQEDSAELEPQLDPAFTTHVADSSATVPATETSIVVQKTWTSTGRAGTAASGDERRIGW